MKLLIVSHTEHYIEEDKTYGWGPTINEINFLADLFDEVQHIAFYYDDKKKPPSSLPYTKKNIKFIPIKPSGGRSLNDKLGVLGAYPRYLFAIARTISTLSKNDTIHVRCPSNVSLLAILFLIFIHKPRNRWVKYAGNWNPQKREACSYTLQRWLLKNNLHRGVVTVNGNWPGQAKHIYSFYNPSLTKEEIAYAEETAKKKSLISPIRFVYVGRIESAKGVGRILDIGNRLKLSGVDFSIDFVGDGPEIDAFKKLAIQEGMKDTVHFHGWKPRTELGKYYEQAHFFLLPSASEGWPKVLSEAMTYGVIPITSNISSIPQILDECGCGKTSRFDDIDSYYAHIMEYLHKPKKWEEEKIAGMKSAKKFSYGFYLNAVKYMFKESWGVRLD